MSNPDQGTEMSEEISKGKRKLSSLEDAFDGPNEKANERGRQRIREFLQRAEDRRKELEKSPPPKATKYDPVSEAKSALRNHIGLGNDRPSRTPVLFFVETGPRSSQGGAVCQLVNCKKRIEEGSYRIAISPGMKHYNTRPDYYHVACFEELVDFSQAAYLDRIEPLTRLTAGMRALKGRSVGDSHYFVDGGAERLILEWTRLMDILIKRRDGITREALDPDLDDLLHKSGSSSYTPKRTEKLTADEFMLLFQILAPIESDGVDDKEEWNLFEQYLTHNFDDLEDLNEPHSLSTMLSHWRMDKLLARADEEELTDKGKEAKERLGEKAIRAIRRLSVIMMPDFRSALFGRLT